MSPFRSALWAEALKARRSKITLLTAAGFMILPLAGGLFMVILKDPERARAMGLIGTKAQITAGMADWPSFIGMLLQGLAAGGAVLFALITAWVFGREFSDHTAKEFLALPTSRETIVGAKLVLVALWALGLALLVFVVGLGIGCAVHIPGWSSTLGRASFGGAMLTALLTIMLMPLVAWFASLGRGYLPPLGWTFLALALANILAVLGWTDWFPWGVPLLVGEAVQSGGQPIAAHSYLMVLLAFVVGLGATFAWWRSADQAR